MGSHPKKLPIDVAQITQALPDKKFRKREVDPSYCLAHATRGVAGGNQWLGTINWFVSNTNGEWNWGPSADGLVGADGRLCVFTDWYTERANWSAGYGASSGTTFGADEHGISIEFAQSAALEDYTQAQIETAARIAVFLNEEWGVPFKQLAYLNQRRDLPISKGWVGHEHTANGVKTVKSDPGSKFPYSKIFARAQELITPSKPSSTLSPALNPSDPLFWSAMFDAVGNVPSGLGSHERLPVTRNGYGDYLFRIKI